MNWGRGIGEVSSDGGGMVRLLVAFLIASSALSSEAAGETQSQPTAAATAGRTKVVILGTGNPKPDPQRSGPCIAILVNGVSYLFDAGPGLVRRAAAAAQKGIASLEASELRYVFLTHLHSDHTLGLPDLMLTGWTMGRDVPLEIYGPAGVQEMAAHLLEAYADDIRIRRGGLEPSSGEGYKVNSYVIVPGRVYEDGNIKVDAFAVPHANWPQAFGYRIESADRTIVLSGDTRPSEAVVNACRGCDVLLHEVYSAQGMADESAEWQSYFADAHTSTSELASLAMRAKPAMLVLYHQMYWGATDRDMVREVQRGYKGKVVAARDLMVF